MFRSIFAVAKVPGVSFILELVKKYAYPNVFYIHLYPTHNVIVFHMVLLDGRVADMMVELKRNEPGSLEYVERGVWIERPSHELASL